MPCCTCRGKEGKNGDSNRARPVTHRVRPMRQYSLRVAQRRIDPFCRCGSTSGAAAHRQDRCKWCLASGRRLAAPCFSASLPILVRLACIFKPNAQNVDSRTDQAHPRCARRGAAFAQTQKVRCLASVLYHSSPSPVITTHHPWKS